MSLFGPSSKLEQQKYYRDEWSPGDLPEFIVEDIGYREFAFDHDGNGPSDRYNVLRDVDSLGRQLTRNAPFSVYCSVAYYREPSRREGIFRTELAFDIDAKDLPVRSCECNPGDVCPKCLDDSKLLALDYIDCLRGDLDLEDIHLIYSGRGYHIRVFDEEISMVIASDRRKILDYVSGGVVPKNLFIEHGYSSIFRQRLLWILRRVREGDLAELSKSVSSRILKKREAIIQAVEDRDRVGLNKMMGERRLGAALGHLAMMASSLTDAKVTMDEKRIIRLPSSLHSKVSMRCMLVEDGASFDPLRDAVPAFVSNREGS
jgi:DNA primase small subunit